MYYALNIDKETNRILSVTFDQYAPADQPRVSTLPEGSISDYLYVDEEFVYDPLPEPEEPEQEPTAEVTTDEMAAAIMEGVNEL